MGKLMKIEWKKIGVYVCGIIILLTIVMSYLSCTLYKNYDLIYDLEAWEIGTTVFDLLYPLAVILPIGWNLYAERKNRFITYASVRVPSKKYLLAKWCMQALSAFAVIFIPYFISAIITLYIKTPIPVVEAMEDEAVFRHAFLSLFVKAPLVYALVISIWKGMIATLVFSFGYVLSMYSKNLIVVLACPFVYTILDNFFFSILGKPEYRLLAAFNPSSVSPQVFSMKSMLIGPAILTLLIFVVWFFMAKVLRQHAVEV